MGSAFRLQCLSGLIIARWPAADGHYAAEAHAAAMATGLGLQLLALGVFLTPRRQSKQMPMSIAVTRALGLDPSIAAAMPAHYAAALSAWRRHVVDARRQVAAWRYAAAASMTLCVGLGVALSLALVRPAVAFHLVEGGPATRISADVAAMRVGGATAAAGAVPVLPEWLWQRAAAHD